MRARIAETKTAAAETSLATLALGCFRGLMMSTIASMVVLISSNTRTKAMVKKRITHSVLEIFSHQPKAIAIRAISK